MGGRGRVALCAVIILLAFSATVTYPFLNWDDQDVFLRNGAFAAPGFVRWAFTTTYMEHYQPLAWLVWGALAQLSTLTSTAAHALTVGLHAFAAALVFVLARRLGLGEGTAFVGALLFGLHPLRVEVVAWASAMPYALALVFALLSTLAFLDSRTHRRHRGLFALSLMLFALSLLARPIALGLPAAFLALDWWVGLRADMHAGTGADTLVRRYEGHDAVSLRAWRIVPFIFLAPAAAYVESRARLTATLVEVGVGARLTLASTAPLKYLAKTLVPIDLTPLDPLALAPQTDVTSMILGAAALGAISWAAWRWRHRRPGSTVAWFSYLALLAPAAGLVPSGLQATADRYMYLPAVPVSLWIASAGAEVVRRRRIGQPAAAVAAAALIGALAVLAHQQTRYWSNSIALWTRAVDVDPRSDIALYNLASALSAAGRHTEALEQYDKVLQIVPDHRDARRNRDLIRAATLEDDANRLAAAGRLDAAIDQYRAAIALDSARVHSQAALGMALVQRSRTADAIPHLREAVRLGTPEPAVSNALAFSLFAAGRTRDACEVLEAARVRFPADQDVARNLTQLGRECAARK